MVITIPSILIKEITIDKINWHIHQIKSLEVLKKMGGGECWVEIDEEKCPQGQGPRRGRRGSRK